MTDTDRPVDDKTARPIRVLHLSITPRGGWHSHAVALVDHLADLPAERHHLVHWSGATRPRKTPSTELRCTWLGRRATGSLVSLRQVAALAREHEADWVQVHGLPSEPMALGFALAMRLALRRSGAAVAVTPHNAFGRRGPIEFRLMRKLTLRLFDRVFVFNETDRRWAGPRAVRTPFVHLATDERVQVRTEASRSVPGQTIVCLPGQIRPDKGYHLVPAALAGQDYAIRIAGPDKGGFAKLESAARRHGLPLLGRPGFADEHDFQSAIAESDVVILPYSRVTQSGVLAYAKAAGTPVAGSMALREAGLAADAYFDLDDNGSLLAAVERAARNNHTAADTARPDHDPQQHGEPDGAAAVAGPTGMAVRLYEPRSRLTDLTTDLGHSSGVFVVGSPRSGTTVAARWLAEQFGVDLPPETHYFSLILPTVTKSASRDELDQRLRRSKAYLDATDDEAAAVADTWWGDDDSPVQLDRYLADGGHPWVEKTPAHLRHWPELLRFDRRSQILAVTRSLPATLVSQTDVPWLAKRHPRSLLARILADRLHIGLLRVVAPGRVRVLRYEDLVTEAPTLGGGPTASMAHETWKAMSDRGFTVADRNQAARNRKPAIWRIGASPAMVACAIPGALARVGIDLVRSLSTGRSAGRSQR